MLNIFSYVYQLATAPIILGNQPPKILEAVIYFYGSAANLHGFTLGYWSMSPGLFLVSLTLDPRQWFSCSKGKNHRAQAPLLKDISGSYL